LVKASHASKFLDEGDKVKVSLRFRGRERGRTQKGFEVMERFADTVKDNGLPEKRAAFEGRNLVMILAPLPDKERRTSAKPKTAAEAAPAPADDAENAKPGAAAEAAPVATPAPATVDGGENAKPGAAAEAAPVATPTPATADGGENAKDTDNSKNSAD
jgi:hypothetical protein